jgi:hypothetical protein
MSAIEVVTRRLITAKSAVRLRRTTQIPMGAALVKADDGAPLAVFADGATDVPGTQITNSESWTVRWNNHAAPLGVATNIAMPQDLDDTSPIDIYAMVSKTGATAGDITSLTIAAYFAGPADLHDADTDCGGVTNAVTPNATAKTHALLTRRIAATDVLAAPCTLALSLTPTAGTLGTDDLLLHSAWIVYTAKWV